MGLWKETECSGREEHVRGLLMRGNVASWKAVKIPLRLKNRERGKEWHEKRLEKWAETRL